MTETSSLCSCGYVCFIRSGLVKACHENKNSETIFLSLYCPNSKGHLPYKEGTFHTLHSHKEEYNPGPFSQHLIRAENPMQVQLLPKVPLCMSCDLYMYLSTHTGKKQLETNVTHTCMPLGCIAINKSPFIGVLLINLHLSPMSFNYDSACFMLITIFITS